MAHFAGINEDKVVQRVLVISDAQEHRGQQFLAEDLGLGGTWIQTSYNGNIRGRFAAVGMIYRDDLDMFIYPQPYPSWTLDEKATWQPPVPYPGDGREYDWDEADQAWVAQAE